ncbi:hypothetical protein KSS87_018173, partial [Heliosperma pusillum]
NPQLAYSNEADLVTKEGHHQGDPRSKDDPEHKVAIEKVRVKNTQKRPQGQRSKTSEWTLGPKENVLMLGWRPNVVEMIKEYDSYLGPGSTVVSLIHATLCHVLHFLFWLLCKISILYNIPTYNLPLALTYISHSHQRIFLQ